MSRNKNANRNRSLGNRLWDADGVEWTADRTGGYHLDPDDVRDLVALQRLPVGLLLDHSAVRWLDADDAEPYELPTHDCGRMLITDWRVLSEMLDDEDVERALHPGGIGDVSVWRATLEP